MRPFGTIRKRKAPIAAIETKEATVRQNIPLRPTQILPAMDIGLQILAGMDPKEARRLHRSLKNNR